MFLLQGCTTYTQRPLLRSSTETWSPEMVGGSFFHPDFAAYFFICCHYCLFFRHLVVVLTDFKWLCFLFQLFWQRTRCSRWVLLRMQNCFRALWLSTEKVWNCLILCSCLKETQAWDSRMFFNGSVVGTSASYQKPIFVLLDNSTF